MSGWAPGRYLRVASQAEGHALEETAAPSLGAASPGIEAAPSWAGRMEVQDNGDDWHFYDDTEGAPD